MFWKQVRTAYLMQMATDAMPVSRYKQLFGKSLNARPKRHLEEWERKEQSKMGPLSTKSYHRVPPCRHQ